MCDLLCALPAATGGPTLFAKNSDRPPGRAAGLRAAPGPARRRDDAGHPCRAAGASDGHPARVRLPPDLGLGPRARGERGRVRRRQRHDLHHARPADGAGRAHRHGPRAARAGAVRTGGRRGRAHRAVAARGRAGWIWSRRSSPAVLVVVPPRGPRRRLRGGDVRQRDGRRVGHRSPRDVEPHDHRPVRHRAPPPAPAGGAAGRPPPGRIAGGPGRAAGDRRLAPGPPRVPRGGADGWTVCMHVDGPAHREATTAAMVAELPVDAGPTVHHVVGSPCTHGWEGFRF